ncbi:MAG TPA: c(7)-type cytochrome triheme domain-containing protein [Burkholderiales bacterium]|nr:c(7)-type cytochrome triheme domain-containing protein [Burkholderiales bacterium]
MTDNFGLRKRALRTLGAGALLLVLAAGAPAQDKRSWKPLAADGVHDPASPAVTQLQAPGDALSKLPPASGGNLVDWGAALQQGLIVPRAGVGEKSGADAEVLELDVLLDPNGSLPPVRFAHADHTRWLDCGNCHPKPFQMEKGASGISMLRILDGEQCGVCHGAIAFPLTECNRCHNLPWGAASAPKGKP